MSREADFLIRLQAIATESAARGLADDVALMPTLGQTLVLTSDTMVEGVHFRSDDPPETVGWKLAAVNLSDLAAKGAVPCGCLLNHALAQDGAWDAAFLEGLSRALTRFAMPLLGGDTVSLPPGAPRTLSLTAIGEVPPAQPVPSRAGARQGDRLYVSGPVGDSGAGLALLEAGRSDAPELVRAYRVPMPHLALGQSVAPIAHAMMDVSDGLLIDAHRIAIASRCEIVITEIPLSEAYQALHGRSVEARVAAATSGDDYVLLAALAPEREAPRGFIEIGHCRRGWGLSLRLDGKAVRLPARLGFEHE